MPLKNASWMCRSGVAPHCYRNIVDLRVHLLTRLNRLFRGEGSWSWEGLVAVLVAAYALLQWVPSGIISQAPCLVIGGLFHGIGVLVWLSFLREEGSRLQSVEEVFLWASKAPRDKEGRLLWAASNVEEVARAVSRAGCKESVKLNVVEISGKRLVGREANFLPILGAALELSRHVSEKTTFHVVVIRNNEDSRLFADLVSEVLNVCLGENVKVKVHNISCEVMDVECLRDALAEIVWRESKGKWQSVAYFLNTGMRFGAIAMFSLAREHGGTLFFYSTSTMELLEI